MSEKTRNLKVGLPEVNLKKESKYQPARLEKREAAEHGHIGHFNTRGKVTSTSGSDYHDTHRPDSGLKGNFAEKDAGINYLRERNKDGIAVRHFSGNNLHSKERMGHIGQTAYNSNPIGEVYKPGTSIAKMNQPSIPDPDAVVYKQNKKSQEA